ncbi:MAG: hypothetical protein ACYCRH_09195 [Acidiferrobacteraceae bacterium]
MVEIEVPCLAGLRGEGRRLVWSGRKWVFDNRRDWCKASGDNEQQQATGQPDVME